MDNFYDTTITSGVVHLLQVEGACDKKGMEEQFWYGVQGLQGLQKRDVWNYNTC